MEVDMSHYKPKNCDLVIAEAITATGDATQKTGALP